MTFRPMPSAAYLREVFTYFPESGMLMWNYRPNQRKRVNSRLAGEFCGSYSRTGFTVRLDGKSYFVSRIAFVMVHGDVLGITDEIDHEDLNKYNNRISNLRKATHRENGANKEMQVNNTSGGKGIDQLPGGGWRVRVAKVHVGVYDTFEEAAIAYGSAALAIYGEFGRVSLLAKPM